MDSKEDNVLVEVFTNNSSFMSVHTQDGRRKNKIKKNSTGGSK